MSPQKHKQVCETDFFQFCVTTMQYVGLWPVAQKGFKRYISRAIFAVHFLATTVTIFALEIAYIYAYTSDYYEFLKTIGVVMYHTICILRIIHWLCIRTTIKKLLSILNRKSFEAFVYDFDEDQTHRKIRRTSRISAYSLFYTVNICGILSLLFSYIHTLAVPMEVYDYSQNKTMFKRVLPYNSYDITHSNSTKTFAFKVIFSFYTFIYTNFCMLCK